MSSIRLALLAGLAVPTFVVGACVVAEPPTDVPTAPAVRPTILRSSTVPPPNFVLTSWPADDRFFVPVRLSDARETFYASYYVDFDANANGYVNTETSSPASGATELVRTLQLAIPKPAGDGCHVVLVIVAKQFADLTSSDQRLAHTPTDPTNDGDSISWFYNSTGDSASCPTFDFMLAPEAGAEGGVDGG